MDGRQKSTLRQYQVKLAEELILDEDFYAALRQRKLFSDQMIGYIKAETTEKDRIYRMIKLLPKRGPEAFEKFIGVLQENFSWLAEMLEDGYEEICQGKDTTDSTDEGKTDPKRTTASTYHNRKSSYEPPTKPRTRAYQSQYSYPASSIAAIETSSPRYAPGVFFAKDFTSDLADAGVLDSQDADSKYKDACVSPILTIESPRKTASAHQKPSQWYERKDISHKMDHIVADTENESDDTDYEDAIDGCPSIATNILISVEKDSIECDGSNDTDNANNADESKHETESNNTKLILDDTVNQCDLDKHQVNDSSRSECQYKSGNRISQDSLEEQRRLKGDIYRKLTNFIDKNKHSYDAHGFKQPVRERQTMENDLDVSLEMIDDLVDEITDMPINEHVKMVEKCYYLVNTKDRKLALNVCIENLNEEIKDLTKKLREEEKKSNEMADDMYKHSHEMKKLDKMRARERHLETDNQILKERCAELEKLREESNQKVNGLQNQILHLQKFLEQENEYAESRREEKKGVRRASQSTRKFSLASVNRRPGLYPSSEPRLVSQKSSYSIRASTRGHASTLRTKRP